MRTKLLVILLFVFSISKSQNISDDDFQEYIDNDTIDYEFVEEDVSNDELLDFLLTEDEITLPDDDPYITFFKEEDYDFEDELTYDDFYLSKDRPY